MLPQIAIARCPPPTKEQSLAITGPAVMGISDPIPDLLKAVNDASTRAFALWITFLTVGIYLAIAIGTTTHTQLLLESPVKLPLLSVDLPLRAFYQFAPPLFVVLHLYVLIQISMLSATACRFDERLSSARLLPSERDDIRDQLDKFAVTQQLVGLPQSGFVPWFLRLTILLSFAAGPVALLVAFQLQFLPYHSIWTSWVHRLALLLDVLMLWALWRGFSRGRIHPDWWSQPLRLVWRGLLGIGCAALVIFSVFVATIPGEWIETFEVRQGWLTHWDRDRALWWPTWILFEGQPDWVRSRPGSLFARNLVLIDANLVELDHDKLAKLDRSLSLRGRDLRFAMFLRADLRKADLTGSELQGAILSGAHLQDASLDSASLRGAVLFEAQLRGASFAGAQLQGANLPSAALQGLSFRGAQLQGAFLGSAQLQGAILDSANLQGANLSLAQMQGASLNIANLQGAWLPMAQLQGAVLQGANLVGALLTGASLQGANLRDLTVWRTRLEENNVELVDARGLNYAPMPEASPTEMIAQVKAALSAADNSSVIFKSFLDIVGSHLSLGQEQALADSWRELSDRKWDTSKDENELAALLARIGCGRAAAPYVARGILRRLDQDWNYGKHAYVPIAARALRDAACVGAHDLTLDERQRLDEMVAQVTP